MTFDHSKRWNKTIFWHGICNEKRDSISSEFYSSIPSFQCCNGQCIQQTDENIFINHRGKIEGVLLKPELYPEIGKINWNCEDDRLVNNWKTWLLYYLIKLWTIVYITPYMSTYEDENSGDSISKHINWWTVNSTK